jgi:hypothetical protein
MDGRPYGKLLARYAGPIAEFLFSHPQASRADLIDFVDRTWGVRVSRIALYHFLKKYGLDRVPGGEPTPTPLPATAALPAPPLALPPPSAGPVLRAGQPVPTPAPPFSPRPRSTRAPSCSCPRP